MNSSEHREKGQNTNCFTKLSHKIFLLLFAVFRFADPALCSLESKQKTAEYEMDQSKYIWLGAKSMDQKLIKIVLNRTTNL